MISRAGSGCLLLVSELLLKFSMASSFFSFLLLVRVPQFGQIVIRLLDVLLVFLAGVFLDPGHSIKCQPEVHQETYHNLAKQWHPDKKEEGKRKRPRKNLKGTLIQEEKKENASVDKNLVKSVF